MTETIRAPYIIAVNCNRGPLMVNRHEDIMAWALVTYGEIAEDEIGRLEKYLKPGMVVIDVGANIGTHATAFEPMVQPGGFVYAIEPHPCNFNILCGNVALRGTQHVFPMRAMAGPTNQLHILPLVDARQPANFGMLTALDREAGEQGGIPTPEIRLDSLGLHRCDLLKIDVEGHEPEVIQGAAGLIDTFSPVILAECLDTVDADKSRDALAPLLRRFGYRLFWLNTRLFRPDNFRGSTDAKEGHDRNILAVKDHHPAELTEGLEEIE